MYLIIIYTIYIIISIIQNFKIILFQTYVQRTSHILTYLFIYVSVHRNYMIIKAHEARK